jgi:hypothetical protein
MKRWRKTWSVPDYFVNWTLSVFSNGVVDDFHQFVGADGDFGLTDGGADTIYAGAGSDWIKRSVVRNAVLPASLV